MGGLGATPLGASAKPPAHVLPRPCPCTGTGTDSGRGGAPTCAASASTPLALVALVLLVSCMVWWAKVEGFLMGSERWDAADRVEGAAKYCCGREEEEEEEKEKEEAGV